MSIWKNGKLVAGGRQVTPLLSFMWADHILDEISWLRADTFSWQNGSVYQAVYQHLANDIDGKSLQSETVGGTTIQFYLADDGHKICPESEMSNVAAIYAATGVAWYYIIDTVNERFKLPRTKFGFTGLRDNVGNYVDAGLPNITGEFWNKYNNTDIMFGDQSVGSGALKLKAKGSFKVCTNSSGSVANAGSLELDASESNAIYGNSTTVQPSATQMYLYFYVGAFTQTALENAAGITAETLNDKVDKGHQVIEFQAPTADNGYAWYRKYADGWVEQGGVVMSMPSSKYQDVVFPVVMANTSYTPSVTGSWSDTATGQNEGVQNTATTGMRVTASYATVSVWWRVEGMAA